MLNRHRSTSSNTSSGNYGGDGVITVLILALL